MKMTNLKRVILLVLAGVMVLCAVSCGKKTGGDGDDTTFETVDYPEFDYQTNDLSSYITLGQYEGLDVKSVSSVVTDEDFQKELNALLESYATTQKVTDRAVVEGDTVVADYAGYLDDVAFSGGTAKNQTITAKDGAGYIPGFGTGFIGSTPGEEFSFNVTFPENYHNKTLAGKEVTFKCKVHHIIDKVLPEITDEFVKEKFNYNNVEEFMIIFRSDVEEYAKIVAEADMFNELWPKVLKNAEVISYPYGTVESLYQDMKVYYIKIATDYYKITYEEFLSKYLNKTEEELIEQCRGLIKEELVIYSLIKNYEIKLEGEEYDKMVERIAKINGVSVETLKKEYAEDSIKSTANWFAVMDRILASANVITEE